MGHLNTDAFYFKMHANNKHSCNDLENKENILIKNKTLYQYCAHEQKKLIVENISCINYRKGEIVFHEGQPSFLIYFISSGVIKLWKEGLHKEGQVIRFAKEGDMVGFWSALENKNYSLSATAITDAHMCYIKKDIFLPIVQTNSTLQIILHDYIKELKKTEDDLRNMAEMNVREKVANAILVLLDVFKNKLDEENYRIILSRREIATLSSICEDSVSKQLSEFKREKIIIMDDDNIYIDNKALQKIVSPYHII